MQRLRQILLMVLGVAIVIPTIYAFGPVPGTDNLIEITQSGGGPLITFHSNVQFDILPTIPALSVTALTAGSVTDTGLTANTMPKASTGGLLANSTITDTGTLVTVNTRTKFLAAMTGASDTSNFFSVTGTYPTVATNVNVGALFSFTTAGSSSQTQRGVQVQLGAGYTGSNPTIGFLSLDSTVGTNVGYGNSSVPGGNTGVWGFAGGATAGTNFGVRGSALNTSTGASFGVLGLVNVAQTNQRVAVAGVAGFGTTGTPLAGAFYFDDSGTTIPTLPITALYASNGAYAVPLGVFSVNFAALPTTGATATAQFNSGAHLQLGLKVLTNGTMTAETQGYVTATTHSYTWTNAMIVALGAVGNGDITVATLPAKTVVRNAYVVITNPDTSANALTVACGRTGATYVDYIAAGDAKAAANTVYGDVVGERGANLTGYDLPSYTATTDVKCHFIKTTTTLDTVTASTGRVVLETTMVP